jgi:hypothetical protein
MLKHDKHTKFKLKEKYKPDEKDFEKIIISVFSLWYDIVKGSGKND